VEAVGVLVRIHGQQCRVEIELLGHRRLDEVAVDLGVGVELRHRRQQVGLGPVTGHADVLRDHPHLGAQLMLLPDVARRRRVVPHQDGAQAHRLPPVGQRLHALADVRHHGVGDRGSGQQLRGHGTHCGGP
jgi:hypothetical protein